jgi:hypothetical protein
MLKGTGTVPILHINKRSKNKGELRSKCLCKNITGNFPYGEVANFFYLLTTIFSPLAYTYFSSFLLIFYVSYLKLLITDWVFSNRPLLLLSLENVALSAFPSTYADI